MLYYRWKKSRGYIDAGKLLDVVETTRREKLNSKINHVRIHSGGIKYRFIQRIIHCQRIYNGCRQYHTFRWTPWRSRAARNSTPRSIMFVPETRTSKETSLQNQARENTFRQRKNTFRQYRIHI